MNGKWGGWGGEGRGSFSCNGQRGDIEGELEGSKGGTHCALTRGRTGGKVGKSDTFQEQKEGQWGQDERETSRW